jgi:hypothetical protein
LGLKAGFGFRNLGKGEIVVEKKTLLLLGAGAVALWLLTRKKAAAAPPAAPKPGVRGYLGQVPYQAWGWEGAAAPVATPAVAAPAGYVWNGSGYVPAGVTSGCPAGMYMGPGGCSYSPSGYSYSPYGYQQPYEYGYQQPYSSYSPYGYGYGYQSPNVTEAMFEAGGMQPTGPVPQVSNV